MRGKAVQNGVGVAVLPRIATLVFCVLTVYVLVADFMPAHRELRQAEALYARQQQRYQRLVRDVAQKRDQVWMLENDPQERERLLDERGAAFRAFRDSANNGDSERDEADGAEPLGAGPAATPR